MSGLVPQNVEIRLGKRDGKTSPMLATPGTITRAENVVMDSTGELRRRPGGSIASTLSSNNGAVKLCKLNNALIVVKNFTASGGTETSISPGAAFAFRGFLANRYSLSNVTSASGNGDQRSHDFVRAGGLDWHVWEDYGVFGVAANAAAIRYSVYDTTTRQAVVFNGTITGATATPFPCRPSIYAVGTDIIVVYATVTVTATGETTPGTLVARKIAQSAPTSVGAAVTVDTFFSGVDINGLGCAYDGQVLTGSSTILALTYKVPGAVSGSRVRIREWNCSTMATSTTSNGADIATTVNGDIGDTALGFLTHTHSDSKYYVGSVASVTGARAAIGLHFCSTATSGVVTDVTMFTTPGSEGYRAVTGWVDTSLTASVLGEQRAGGPAWPTPTTGGATAATRGLRLTTRTSGGVVTSNLVNWTGFGIGSKPWLTSKGDWYMLVTYTSQIDPTYFVVRAPASALPTIIARFFPGSAGLLDADALETGTNARVYRPARGNRVPSATLTGNAATIPVYRMGANSSVQSPQREAYIVTLQPTAVSADPVNVCDALMLADSHPVMYDGQTADAASSILGCELGFHVSPEPIRFSGTGRSTVGGNTLTLTARYQYAYCFSWKDAAGRFHVSAPSPVQEFTLSGTENTITLDLVRYPATSRVNGSVQLLVFRSDANPGTNAPLYFRASIPNVITGSFPDPTVQYVDGNGAFSSTGEQLYTMNGAVLENAPWPNISEAVTWKNRVIALLQENNQAWCFSKLVKDGYGLEFNDDFQGVIDDSYGRLYGLAPLGERLLFFKENAVYFIGGSGPGDDGNGTFDDPLRIDGIPGCNNPRSILTTPLGVFYQSTDQNIWLITFGLESKFIGRPIADVTSVAGNITAALHEPEQQHARFYNSVTGNTVVYDLVNDFWMTYTGQQVVSAIMYNGAAHYLTTTPRVLKEETLAGGVFQENGVAYQGVIELAWLALAQLNGYVRTWVVTLLGRLFGVNTLTLEMVADYGTAITSRALASSAVQTAHGYRIEAPVPMQMQQNTSVKLLIKDDSPNTAGWGIDGITLQCGFAPGRRPRLPAAHRAT